MPLGRFAPRRLLQRAGFRSLLGTGLGSATGLILPFALSAHFGAGSVTDRFAYSLALVNLVGGLFDGTIQASTVPGLEYARRKGRAVLVATIRRYAWRLPVAALAAYVAVVVVALGVFEPSTASAVPGSPWLLAATFALFLGALIVSSVASATLYVFNVFFAPTATAGLRSVIPLLTVPFLGFSPESLLIVAGLMALGEALRATYLSVRVVREVRASDPAPSPVQGAPPRTASMAFAYGTSMFFAGMVPIVTRGAAGELTPGSITVFDLSEKLMFVPVTALGAVFVVVAGARWSRILHDAPEQLAGDFWRRLRMAVVAATAAAVALTVAVFAVTGIAGADFAGAPSDDLRLTVAILSLTLPAGIAISLCSRLLGTFGATRSIPIIGVTSLLIAGGGSLLTVSTLGLPGIALSLLAARLVSATYFVGLSRYVLRVQYPAAAAEDGLTAAPARAS